jgi:hypothetical protein
MNHEVNRPCGKVSPVSGGAAGPEVSCGCGRELPETPSGVLHDAAVAVKVVYADEGESESKSKSAVKCAGAEQRFVPNVVSVADLPSADEGSKAPEPRVVIIPPMQASLRTWQGERRGGRTSVMAALTTDAVHFQDAWRLGSVPLGDVRIERRRGRDVLAMTHAPTCVPDAPAQRLVLSFASRPEAAR